MRKVLNPKSKRPEVHIWNSSNPIESGTCMLNRIFCDWSAPISPTSTVFHSSITLS